MLIIYYALFSILIFDYGALRYGDLGVMLERIFTQKNMTPVIILAFHYVL